MAKILLGKGPTKENPFLDVTPIHLEVNLLLLFIRLIDYKNCLKIKLRFAVTSIH